MTENTSTNVVAAIEMLLEEIEAEITFLNEVGRLAFEARDYEKARAAAARAERITAFRNKAQALRREWQELLANRQYEQTSGVEAKRRDLERAPRGSRTSIEEFYRPILEALVELGGTAPVTKVLEVVGKKMQGVLKDLDYEPLPSQPGQLRWSNTARWARQRMIQQGLLRNDSPRGVWEISEAGIEFLRGGQPQ